MALGFDREKPGGTAAEYRFDAWRSGGSSLHRSPGISAFMQQGAAPRQRFSHPRWSAPENLDGTRRVRTGLGSRALKNAPQQAAAAVLRADRPPPAARSSANRG